MAPEQIELLNLRVLPGRLNLRQTAHYLGFEAHEIPILIARGMIKPLGRPARNAPKYFASVKVQKLWNDEKWMDRAMIVVGAHWKRKRQGSKIDGADDAGSDYTLKAVNE